MSKRIVHIIFALALLPVVNAEAQSIGGLPPQEQTPEIIANTNRKSAGRLQGNVLTIKLEARTGLWYPETKDGPALRVQAIAEQGGPLQIPGPLIRVPADTEIRATIHNSISGSTLVMHGFHSRPGDPKDTFEVAPGESREVRFKAGAVGTYYYWATTGGPLWRNRPYSTDSQLTGALIIDPAGGKLDADERILMLGIWGRPGDEPTDPSADQRATAVINGRSWPYTERLTYASGQTVRWRVINASSRSHPMHLHGFYFSVNSKGDGETDTIYQEQERRLVVTQVMVVGQTLSVTWVPQRAGSWLFHCHLLEHITPELRLRPRPTRTSHSSHDDSRHAFDEMAGMVMGIHILPARRATMHAGVAGNRKNLTLVIQEQPGRFGAEPGLGYALQQGTTELPPKQISIPGPLIVLTRGQPVSIKLVNKLHEATSVHWHGMELESYYDGVPGWSGSRGRITPPIAPGGTFVAEMTPPRAGTFIYHTHWHDDRQLKSGLYGPLVVLEPGQKFDPDTDQILLISNGGPRRGSGLFLNGSNKPEPMRLRAGVKYRFRLINIMANAVTLSVSLLSGESPVNWRAIAKDGFDLSPTQAMVKPARQAVSPGETFDFEYEASSVGDLRFEVRGADTTGKLPVQMTVQMTVQVR